MIDTWRVHNRDTFIRDIIRDYCKVHIILSEQAARFAHSGTISYAVLNELLGDVLRKGVLWRLKDNAHHLFRASPAIHENCVKNDTLADMLDWCVGYAFHECVKLKEDAFQRQHYTNRLLQLHRDSSEYDDIFQSLMPFTKQTNESISRELERILGVLTQIRNLLLIFLKSQSENTHVARLLVEDSELVQRSFGGSFNALLTALYADMPTNYYMLALRLTLSNGREDKALSIISKARENNVPQGIIDDLEKLMANVDAAP